MTTSSTGQVVVALVRHFISSIRWRAMLLLLLMILAALSEGLGLLLVLPLLVFAGIAAGTGLSNPVVDVIAQVAAQLGVTLSLELVLVIFTALIIVRQTIVFYSARLTADTRVDYVADLRQEFFASLGSTSWRHLTGGRLDQLGHILLVDSWRVGEAALHFVKVLGGVILLAANAAVAILISPALALSLLGGILLLTVLFSNRIYVVQKQGQEISAIHNRVYTVVENYLDNIRVAKMAGATDQMQENFGAAMDALGERLSGFVRETESIKMAMQIAGAIAIAVALWIAVNVLQTKGPELLLLVFITARFVPRVSVLNQDLHRLAHELPAFVRAMDLLEDCQRHPDFADQDLELDRPERSIAVHGATVLAHDRPGLKILDNVSLDIPVGAMVAVTGHSGAGKSTLMDVLAGLTQPDGGEIRLDGITLEADRICGWRRRVGYVAQTAALLQGSILHNLSWLLTELPDDARLGKVLQCVEVDKVVSRLPSGLETIIDRREGGLSGGERQRIAIARELLRSPDLLILDEATNALDIEMERQVLQNIRTFYPNMSILIVAHRPAAIALADREIKLSGGEHARES